MKISTLECLHADGGFRNLDFVKITTGEGLVGWSDLGDAIALAVTPSGQGVLVITAAGELLSEGDAPDTEENSGP